MINFERGVVLGRTKLENVLEEDRNIRLSYLDLLIYSLIELLLERWSGRQEKKTDWMALEVFLQADYNSSIDAFDFILDLRSYITFTLGAFTRYQLAKIVLQ